MEPKQDLLQRLETVVENTFEQTERLSPCSSAPLYKRALMDIRAIIQEVNT